MISLTTSTTKTYRAVSDVRCPTTPGRGGVGRPRTSTTSLLARGRDRGASCVPGWGTPRASPPHRGPRGGAHPGHHRHTGVPGVGHDPGHQRPFFASSWENRTKTVQKQKNVFFCDLPTIVAFWTISVYIKDQISPQSSQVAEKQIFSIFTRPIPGQHRRCDGPTPGHTPGCACVIVVPGSGHPG